MSTDTSVISEVALNGLFEFGLGLGLGAVIDTVAPAQDESKGWQAEAIETAITVSVNAVVLQTAGSFLIRRVSPGNTSAGILLGWGMFLGQPNLLAKVKEVVAGLKIGAVALASQQAAVIAKTQEE